MTRNLSFRPIRELGMARGRRKLTQPSLGGVENQLYLIHVNKLQRTLMKF